LVTTDSAAHIAFARLAFAALALLAGGALDAASAEPDASAVPLTYQAGYERVRLVEGESTGLTAGKVLFEVVPGWWAGPVLFGAMTGERGGLFALGGELQRRWLLPHGFELGAGLTVGGGGGAAAPVGDGLFLRPALTLVYGTGPLRAGLSWSSLRFPGTTIDSRQFGVVLEWRDAFVYHSPAWVGQTVPAPVRSGLGLDTIALVGARSRLRSDGDRHDLDLVGVRVTQRFADRISYWGLESTAAVQRTSAGYMEVLLLAGREWLLGEQLRAGARAAIGGGGGGAVPTRGGLLGRLDGTLALRPWPGWQIGTSIGWVQGQGGLSGSRSELWLGADLEPAEPPGDPGRRGTVVGTAWLPTLQSLDGVARHDGSRRSLQTIGLGLQWSISQHVYLGAQGHSAYGGGAGAYGMGLVGVGFATTSDFPGWQWGAEALAGAAGGGGVEGVRGAIGQALLYAGFAPAGSHGALQVGIGAAGTLHGGETRPLVSVRWSIPLGQTGR
jgi:hypothetical protein